MMLKKYIKTGFDIQNGLTIPFKVMVKNMFINKPDFLIWFILCSLVVVGMGFFAQPAIAMSVDTDVMIIPSQNKANSGLILKPSKIGDWDSQFATALLQIMDGNYGASETTYTRILETSSDDSIKARALLSLGELYHHYLEDYKRAYSFYETVLQKYPHSKQAESALFSLGLVNFHQRNFTEAYSEFSTYYSSYPEGKYWDNAKFMAQEAALRLGINVSRTVPTPSSTYVMSSSSVPRISGYKARVALLQKISSVDIYCRGSYTIWSVDGGIKIKDIGPGAETRFSINHGTWMADYNELNGRKILIIPEAYELLSVQGKKYRGAIQLIQDDGKITVVNIVPLEEYIYSVVPAEVSKTWPMEALKAQAVAARTYAMCRMAVRGDYEFDLNCGQSDQVYGGYEAEKEQTTRAVDETKGEILTYDGEPILCYFHSNSGGKTEDAFSAFGLKRPYLKSVPDPYSKNAPGYHWVLRISAKELQRRLSNKGYNVTSIHEVLINNKTTTGRVKSVKVMHSGGAVIIPGNDFRWKVDSTMMRSTLFTIRKEGNYFTFNGYGYGHGVGLSQWGCYRMAQTGRYYKDILAYYYPSADFATL